MIITFYFSINILSHNSFIMGEAEACSNWMVIWNKKKKKPEANVTATEGFCKQERNILQLQKNYFMCATLCIIRHSTF